MQWLCFCFSLRAFFSVAFLSSGPYIFFFVETQKFISRVHVYVGVCVHKDERILALASNSPQFQSKLI